MKFTQLNTINTLYTNSTKSLRPARYKAILHMESPKVQGSEESDYIIFQVGVDVKVLKGEHFPELVPGPAAENWLGHN